MKMFKYLVVSISIMAGSSWGAVATSIISRSSDDWGGAALNSAKTSWLGGGTDSTGTLFRIGKSGATFYYTGALKFRNITIPQGATIDSAELWGRETGFNDTSHVIVGAFIVDNDSGVSVYDSGTWRTAWNARSTATRSCDTANILPSSPWTTQGVYYRLPFNKLDSIIQIVVGRAGWISGSSLTLIIDALGNCPDSVRTNQTWDVSGNTKYDSLWISYTVGGGGGGGTPNTIVRSATIRSATLRAPERMFYRRESWKW